MGWLERLRRSRSGSGPPGEVVVVSRAGCHLCAQMEQVVRDVLAEKGGTAPALRVVDLDEAAREDPGLLERWSTMVPVLLVDGREVAHWQVDAGTVRAALRR